MTKNKHASLKDIAAKLGISIATVSRALKGNPSISKATRDIVMQAAEEMNYSKNFIADSLRSGQLPLIGVIVPHAVTLFYSSVLDGIEHEAAKEGYAVISMNSHESYEEECANMTNMRKLHVAGVIAAVTQETADFRHFAPTATDGPPVVFVAREPPDNTHSAVVADGVEAAHRATTHLISQGCRRIAILCGPNRLKMVTDRKHGYIEALHDNNIRVKPEYVAYASINTEDAIAATERLLALPERPDAILALNDTLLFGAMKAIKKAGLDIPREVALIGFSDVEYAEDVSPTLSTIEDQSRLMGETACRILMSHINGSARTVRKIIPTIQKIRGSSLLKG